MRFFTDVYTSLSFYVDLNVNIIYKEDMMM